MSCRPGMALPMVLWALALLSALAVGGSFVARRALADERSAVRSSLAEPGAEQTLAALVASWDDGARSSQQIGASVALGSVTGVGTNAWVTRLAGDVYWLVAESEGGGWEVRRLGVLIRVTSGRPTLIPDRAWAELP